MKPSISLDSSCFEKNNSILKELMTLHRDGKIVLCSEILSYIEINKLKNEEKKKALMRFIDYTKQDLDVIEMKDGEDEMEKFNTQLDKEHEISKRVMKIYLPSLKSTTGDKINQYADIRILALSIIHKRDFFLTKDNLFLHDKNDNDKTHKFEKEFGIKVRKFDKNSMKEIQSVIIQN